MAEIQVSSSTTLLPETKQNGPTTVPLSIIDATVANFARTAAVWYYNATASGSTPSDAHWRASISKTLDSYPQWCGQLSWSKYVPSAGHTNRLLRVHLTYGASSDPGVLFVSATSPQRLDELVPDIAARKREHKIWNGEQSSCANFFPKEALALHAGSTAESAAMQIQITTLACGGIAVAVALTHSIADAQSLATFMKDWSATSRALVTEQPLPNPHPIFDPQLLDSAAAGDIDVETPDTAIIEQARALPCHRFDWYIPVIDQPSWITPKPAEFDRATINPLSPGTPIPWHEWDLTAKSVYRIFHFSPEEFDHIYYAANPDGRNQVSKHEAIIAHIWSCINRARNLGPDATVYLDHTFGLRQRLEPRLPDNFLGSPIMLAAISSTPSKLSNPSSLPQTAALIHDTLQVFNSKALAAHFHASAFEPGPQRLWQAFLGLKHVLLATWIHLGVWNIDFGGMGVLRCVQPVVPVMDGLVEILEAGKEEGWREGQHWTSGGVDVSVYLEEGAMERLVKDPYLWVGS